MECSAVNSECPKWVSPLSFVITNETGQIQRLKDCGIHRVQTGCLDLAGGRDETNMMVTGFPLCNNKMFQHRDDGHIA